MINKYFVNCRGATFNKVHATEWDESGHMPRLASPFLPYTSNFDEQVMTFVGSNKTSNWLHWDSDEASTQLDYLKGIGINLVRVYGDMYCWGAFTTRYLTAVSELAALCNAKKMYIQWVLFDGYTDEDTPSANYDIGYFDPSTSYESVSWGIKRWQRCPNVNANDLSTNYDYYKQSYGLPTRDASSMAVSGDSYVTDMVSAAGSSKATLSWEVMHDVNMLANEPEGFGFVTSAINKVNSIKYPNQKTTFSAKNINAFDDPIEPGGSVYPDTYSSGIVELLTPLVDFVCELTTNFTTPGFINSYLRLQDFSTKTGKPVMLIDSFNESLVTPFDLFKFSKDFNIGVICEGMVDRSFSRKPNNSTKGILYDDGQSRRYSDASSIVDKAYTDGIGKSKVSTPTEKTSWELLVKENLNASSFDRFNTFEETGAYSWSSIYNASREYVDYSAIPVGFSPMASSVSSTFAGWGLVGDSTLYNNLELFSSIATIRSNLIRDPLSSTNWRSDVERDQFGHKILTKLIKLTEDLDMHKPHNYYNTTNYTTTTASGYLASSYQESLFSSASAFLPMSLTKTDTFNASPFVGTPRYLSAMVVSEGPYREDENYLQKPLGYWIRTDTFKNGCCNYISTSSVEVSSMDISAVDIIGNYIDWPAYDVLFLDWSDNLYNAYVNINNNLRQYLLTTLGDDRVSSYLPEQSYLP